MESTTTKSSLNSRHGKSHFQLHPVIQDDHEVLRTPPYHPELQPIETCWGIVKNQVARNCDFTIANQLLQLDAAFASENYYI